jgi:hypothetical protein
MTAFWCLQQATGKAMQTMDSDLGSGFIARLYWADVDILV